jgi:hypothetical protein
MLLTPTQHVVQGQNFLKKLTMTIHKKRSTWEKYIINNVSLVIVFETGSIYIFKKFNFFIKI